MAVGPSNLTETLDLELQVRASIGGIDISTGRCADRIYSSSKERSGRFDTYVIPAPAGGQALKLLTGPPGHAWSPDGKRLVAMQPGSVRGDELIVADAEGDNKRVIVPLSGGRHAHWPAWSRDGAFIYFVCTFMGSHEEPTELCRVPSDGTGPIEVVVTTERRAMNAAPAPDGSVLFSANPKSLDAGLWWKPKSGGDPVAADRRHRRVRRDLLVRGRSPRCFDNAGCPAIVGRDPRYEPERRPGPADHRRILRGDVIPSSIRLGRRLTFSSTRGGARTLWLAQPDASQAHHSPAVTRSTIVRRSRRTAVESRSYPAVEAGRRFGWSAPMVGLHSVSVRRTCSTL